jgi:hypothetical protein
MKILQTAGESPVIQGLALMLLLCVLAIAQLHTQSAVWDPDIWWHVRTGQWIIQHHAFPHVGVFSQTGAARPWAAYSWGFEIPVACLSGWLGLKGLMIFVMAFGTILTLVLFSVLRNLSKNFWTAWLLTGVAIWGANVSQISAPRPVLFSILFFTIELGLVLKAQQTGDKKFLYWLVPLFLFWANFHIQFVYGLLLPGLLAARLTLDRWARRRQIASWPDSDALSKLHPGQTWGVLLGCVAATLINPYGVGLYQTIVTYMHSSYMYQVVMELQAPSFRDSSHYVELMLVGVAFFTLGRRRPLDLFHLALLTVASVVAFRTLRDAWFLCIGVAAIVAFSSGKVAEVATPAGMPREGLKVRGVALAVAGAICVIALRSWDSGLSNRNLEKTVRNSYPLDAVRYVQQQRLPGPLFNNYNWGGFLIDTLPEYPVSIDSRGDLYGDNLLQREIRTLNAVDWMEDPALDNANLILLPAQLPLARALQRSPQFKIVYADNMAVIFIRGR